MICGAASVVEQHKQQINELNVFPVPDGDTGTNMSMTLNAAAADLRKLHEPTLTKVADATASAMLRGARGNSGVILSLLFRGFSRSLKGLEECDGRQLAAALQAGVEAAYKAVMKPAEGTILTVARIAAEQAVEVDEPCFETVLTVAIDGATGALADTVEQNPVLKKAGVVDAGGKGWLYVLQTMLDVAQGKEIAEPTVAAPEKHYGMVAVCAGEGLANAFRELGADNIISGGQTMNPSTQDILEKVNATPAEVVFVFPNNKNIIMAAEQVQPLTEKKVVVIPSKTVPQGISAMLVFDPDAGEDSNAAAMREAMKNVTTMQLTYAARDSDFDGHDIHAGEYLALNGGALFGNDTDMDALLRRMAENLNGAGKEFITIFYGADTNEEQAHNAAAIFSAACPDAEITVMNGGQPVYYFLISAE